MRGVKPPERGLGHDYRPGASAVAARRRTDPTAAPDRHPEPSLGRQGRCPPQLGEPGLEAPAVLGGLEEARIEALQLRIQADLACGRQAQVVAELRRLLVEGRDEVGRALRNQSRDRQAAND